MANGDQAAVAPKKTHKPKLKIEITCEVEKDGSLGKSYVTSKAGNRSGYCLRNPFSVLVDVRAIIQKSFIKTEEKRRVKPDPQREEK